MTLDISILAAFLSVLIVFFNWRRNKNSIFLAAFFITLSSYSITHYFIFYKHSLFGMAVFYNHFAAFWLLLGPMLYFYTRGSLNDNSKLIWKDSWHFIPAIIQLINTLPYYAKPFSYKLQLARYLFEDINHIHTFNPNWLYPPIISIIGRIGSLLLYSLYIFWLLYKAAPSKQDFTNRPYRQYILSYRWILILNSLALTIAICYCLLAFSVLLGIKSILFVNSDPLHMLMSIAFLLFPISLLVYPQALYGMPIVSIEVTKPIKPKKIKITEKPIVENNEVDPFQILGEEIMSYIEKNKPYLNPDFSLTDISIALKVPQHHVSYCFTTILKIKFSHLKNQLRVATAKELLIEGMANELSIEGVAHEAGFASRSNFYSIFKSETGMTPNEFLQLQKN